MHVLRTVYLFFLLWSDGHLFILLPLQPRLFLLLLSCGYNCLQLRHLLLLGPPLPQLQTHMQIDTGEKQKNRVLAINSYPESITHRETTSWVPPPWCQTCQGCLSHLVLDCYRTHQIFELKKTMLMCPNTKRTHSWCEMSSAQHLKSGITCKF